MKYYALITYPGSCKEHLMATPGSAVRHLLEVMGDRLLNENIISSYQIVVTDGEEVNNSTKD